MLDADKLLDQILDLLTDEQMEKNDIHFALVNGEPHLIVYENA